MIVSSDEPFLLRSFLLYPSPLVASLPLNSRHCRRCRHCRFSVDPMLLSFAHRSCRRSKLNLAVSSNREREEPLTGLSFFISACFASRPLVGSLLLLTCSLEEVPLSLGCPVGELRTCLSSRDVLLFSEFGVFVREALRPRCSSSSSCSKAELGVMVLRVKPTLGGCASEVAMISYKVQVAEPRKICVVNVGKSYRISFLEKRSKFASW